MLDLRAAHEPPQQSGDRNHVTKVETMTAGMLGVRSIAGARAWLRRATSRGDSDVPRINRTHDVMSVQIATSP